MRTIEEIPQLGKVFSAHVKGAIRPSGWLLRCISGDEKYRISRGEWIARFSEYDENDYGFTFAPDMSFAVYWKTEAEAAEVSNKLRGAGVETEVVRSGAPIT